MSYPVQGSLSDPPGFSALLDAVAWLQETLLGTAATTIAIIAVAATGLMMLSGRVDWRRGATTLTGCFILFGASSIAAGIRSASAVLAEPVELSVPPTYPPAYAAPALPKSSRFPPQNGYDPYAGAAVPTP